MMCKSTGIYSTGIYQTQMSAGAGGVAGSSASSTPSLASASLDVPATTMDGGTRHVITGIVGLVAGAFATIGSEVHGLEFIDETSGAFIAKEIAYGSQGLKDLTITNPGGLVSDTLEDALEYTLAGDVTVTTWADFVNALSTGADGLVVRLSSTLGVVARARVASANVFNFPGWIDLRLASEALIDEMFSNAFGAAYTSLAPHASTGGLLLNCGTDAQGTVVLDDVQCDGAYRGIIAEIVWDTIDDASIGYNKGFCAGFRARGVADTSTTLRGGGPAKTSSNTYRWSYCYNSLQGFTVTNSSAAISAGAINSAGVVCTCFYFCNQNGNVGSGSGDAGVDVAGGSVPTQTAGPAVAVPNNTVVHTDRTDLQPVFCNNAVDGSNVLRLIRFKLFGDFSKF